MLNFFKKKKIKHLTIKCGTDYITVNDQIISFPTNYNTLSTVFGKPSREIQKSNHYIIWDDYGIFCGTNDLNNILSINFYQNKKDKTEYNTKKQFKGDLFLNDEKITNSEFGKIALGKVVIHRLGSESETRFGFSLGANMDYK